MNREKWKLLGAVLALIGVTAGFLGRLQLYQKLGPPGLKMVARPVYDEKGALVGTNTVDLPERVLDYHSTAPPITTMEVNWLPGDTTFGRRAYEAPDHFSMVLSVVLMGADRGSIHKPQICLQGQGWKIEQSDLVTVPVVRPHAYDLPVMRLTSSREVTQPGGTTETVRSLYAYWFVAQNHLTARHGERMWWMAKDLILTGTLQRWAYVSCWAPCLPGQEEATWTRMSQFISASVPEFQLTSGPTGARADAASGPIVEAGR